MQIADSTKPRAVADMFYDMDDDHIRQRRTQMSFPYGICCTNIQFGINIGSMVRAANGFGAREVVLYGSSKYNRVSAVGSYKYINTRTCRTTEEFAEVAASYDQVISIETPDVDVDIPKVSLWDMVFDPTRSYLFCFGAEAGGPEGGVPLPILEASSMVLYVPMYGTIRSHNVSMISMSIMSEYVRQLHKDFK